MSETKQTPVQRAAEAIGRYALEEYGLAVPVSLCQEDDADPHGPWDRPTLAAHEVSRTAFASIDVDGLAAEIGRHWLHKPTVKLAYLRAVTVTRVCDCGHELRPQYFEWRHNEEHNAHVAEEIKRWLGGGA